MRIFVFLLCAGLAMATGPAASAPVELRVIALNDFHGNLQATPFAFEQGAAPEPAGGAVALAAAVARLRKASRNSVFVSAGDLIGASPLPSALAHDEPTLALFKHLGLAANAIGNHELDGGLVELRRQEALAGVPFVSANLVDAASGEPVFAPYRIIEVEGVRVAFVGATVRNALKPLEPDSVPGLRLDDEADALNAQAAALRAQGVHALVALLHEGAGAQEARIAASACDALAGPARAIAEKLSPDYDLVLSAHTHGLYACRAGGRWLLQGGANGRYLSVADLRIDRASGDVIAVDVRNEPVRADASLPVDPAVVQLVDSAIAAAAKISGAPVASLSAQGISASADSQGGSPLGRLVARAQLQAGKATGAELACTNPSSVPRDLLPSLPDNFASYADVRAVQPYGNRLKLRRVSGAQLRALLEQQWREGGVAVLLSCSPGVGYRVDASRRVVAGSLRLRGRALRDEDTLVLVANSYLARGGQGFSALTDAPELGDAGLDLDALLAWLRAGEAAK
jgi:5'-nucleotidase